jgi:F-type H+-transporting ATPase subunit gamma
MAKPRQIVKRRKAVRNIRKITRTMQLIATARFQAAQNRATATKPYTEKLSEMVGDVAAVAGNIDLPLLRTNDDAKETATVVLTSNRGLCGGYNANVLKKSIEHLKGIESEAMTSHVHMVGKKGVSYFKFLNRPVGKTVTNIDDKPQFDQVAGIADELMDSFEAGRIRSAEVVYMQFLSAGVQRPAVVTLLPLASGESDEQSTGEDGKGDGETKGKVGPSVEYEFSPDPKELLEELLPMSVRARLFQAFTDAAVSEQIARMVAMKAATDAAGDMIKSLTRQYNRARQAQITLELLDIMGGVEALKG